MCAQEIKSQANEKGTPPVKVLPLTLGTHFFMCVIIGSAIGWWTQKTFGIREPWGWVGGLFLGFFAGCWELYKASCLLSASEKKDHCPDEKS